MWRDIGARNQGETRGHNRGKPEGVWGETGEGKREKVKSMKKKKNLKKIFIFLFFLSSLPCHSLCPLLSLPPPLLFRLAAFLLAFCGASYSSWSHAHPLTIFRCCYSTHWTGLLPLGRLRPFRPPRPLEGGVQALLTHSLTPFTCRSTPGLEPQTFWSRAGVTYLWATDHSMLGIEFLVILSLFLHTLFTKEISRHITFFVLSVN